MNKIRKDTNTDWQKKKKSLLFFIGHDQWESFKILLEGQFHRSRIEYPVFLDEFQN
jgi:hypothetical protein